MPYLDKEELYKREPLVLISLIDLKDKKPGDIIVQKRFGENLIFSFYSHCILSTFNYFYIPIMENIHITHIFG